MSNFNNPPNERGLVMPRGLGDETDDVTNWVAIDKMIQGTHPVLNLLTADENGDVTSPSVIAALQAVPSGAYISITGDKTLTDDPDHAGIAAGTHILQGLSYICTSALTVSLPDSLTATGATVILPPASGNMSADPIGTATANGASTTLTRTRANNWTGVAIVHLGGGAYGINGG